MHSVPILMGHSPGRHSSSIPTFHGRIFESSTRSISNACRLFVSLTHDSMQSLTVLAHGCIAQVDHNSIQQTHVAQSVMQCLRDRDDLMFFVECYTQDHTGEEANTDLKV